MFDIMTATVFYSRGQDGLWSIGSMERACHELREIIKGPHHKMNNRLINLMLSATGARVPSCPWLVLAALLSAFTGPASAITLWLQKFGCNIHQQPHPCSRNSTLGPCCQWSLLFTNVHKISETASTFDKVA